MGGKPGRSGGKRPGSGRKLGKSLLNMKSRKVAELAAETGKTPLEYVLSVMNDEKADLRRRDWAAEVSMGYVHPRLANVAVAAPGNSTMIIGSVVIESVPTGARISKRFDDDQLTIEHREP
jgi:hypothetical protein